MVNIGRVQFALSELRNIGYSIFILTISTTIGLYGQSPDKIPEEALKLVEVWLDAQKDYDRLPGISALVLKDQAVIWSGGFGSANEKDNVDMDATTICSICSISKLFTSVAIMKLYEEGKIRLDDRIEDLLPHYNLTQKYPESGPITVESLLTHSSGLPREAAYSYWTGPDFPFPSLDQVNARLEEQETLFPASTFFQYSNLGMTLLGEIVAEVSGMPFEEYIIQHILKPLELSDTRPFLPEEHYGNDLAFGYSSLNRKGDRDKVNLFQARGITAAAGFSSNVLDLGKFAAWQFRLRDTTASEILESATLKYMHQVHWTNPDWQTTWGLGFVVRKGGNGNTWVGHGGSCPGYRSSLQMDLKRKMAFAVMINAGGTNPDKYVDGINEIISKAEFSQSEEAADSNESKIPDLSDFTGYYDLSPWWGEVYVGTCGDKLVSLALPSDHPGSSLSFYKHLEGDVFQRIRDDGNGGEKLIFVRNQQGEIIHYISHDNLSRKIQRKEPEN